MDKKIQSIFAMIQSI